MRAGQRYILTLLCMLSLLFPIAGIPAVNAQTGTTSIHIVKYAADGVTVIDETTISCSVMEANLPVQGDGVTHYFHQGPSFDDENLWDPDETLNLKDKGALKGTDLKDLCNLAGGMAAGESVKVKSIDNFSLEFAYADVYQPEPEQGKMVVCWYRNGSYVPAFGDGMQLVFFAETVNGAGQRVFGNEDMHTFLPEENRHYYNGYPSSNGLSAKYISDIIIYSGQTVDYTATTSVDIVKYASDDVTVIGQTTVGYQVMEADLPIQGDGTTHYFHQGPTLNAGNPWNPGEDCNLKDKGALKGTDLKDLCDLAGGMAAGEEVQVKSADGSSVRFAYTDVYQPEPEQGKIVICWYRNDDYVPEYNDGIHLVFFAETVNGAGQYVFGNEDMHAFIPEDNWGYWNEYPSSDALSLRYVTEIAIYSNVVILDITTTALNIVAYAADGTTIIKNTTIDYQAMEAELPVQGDGTTHYFHQGPSFDDNNLWDPAETVNLKDKGALKGTDLKDLCNLVGGMAAGETVKVKAADNFSITFSCEDAYQPEPEQGKMVVCWYKNGSYVPLYNDGMQLVFFAGTVNGAGKHVFGNEDMHSCLREENWHYYNGYPSSNGLSVRYISDIIIYSSRIVDIDRVMKIIVGLETFSMTADTNLDGKINALDITTVKRILAGIY